MLLTSRQEIYWTEHAKFKLRRYGLSESRVKRILRLPKRLEVGVAPDTVAAMQPAGSKKHPYEVWVMWAQVKSRKLKGESLKKKLKIISAWKYPGISPIHEPPPIPEDDIKFTLTKAIK